MEQTPIWIVGLLSFVFFPLLLSMVDFLPALRAKRTPVIHFDAGTPTYDDFAVLVPIYGAIRYLVNVPFLSGYGDRVILCTTDQESAAFYADLQELTRKHGFRVVRTPIPGAAAPNGKRSTTSPVRDVVVRAAVRTVKQEFVICLDGDSHPRMGFEYLVGAMKANGLEMVSVELVPANQGSLLGKFQRVEYFLGMELRRLIPWLVSGGCHAATTQAYTRVMNKHSMFFQGNDVEVGLLAERMGYAVGHVSYIVDTEVPDRIKGWFRQRYAWSGGEWRLAVANIKLAPSHPWFFCYATVIMIGMFPLRWYLVVADPWILIPVYLIYVVLISILLRGSWSWICLIYPVYAAFNSLIMVPLGGISYLTMSMRHHNWGQIDRDRQRPALGTD